MLDCSGQLFGDAGHFKAVFALNGHPQHGFGAGGPDQNAEAVAQRLRLALQGQRRPVEDLRRGSAVQVHVDRNLRQFAHAGLELVQRLAGFDHERQRLQRRHDAVAGGGQIQAQDMARGLSPQHPALLPQQLQNVTVAHIRADKRNFQRLQAALQTGVGHVGADNAPAQAPLALPLDGDQVEEFVPVNQFPFVVHHDHAVAVAIKSDA